MRYKQSIIFGAILGIFGMLVGGIIAVDAESTPKAGVQISPIRFDWQMTGGEQKTDEIVVHNFSDIPHSMSVSVEDFFVSDDTLEPNFFIPDDEHPRKAYDVIDWIDAPEDFVLEPGETKKLQFKISVPEGQPTSGYYGSIFFKTRTDDAYMDSEDGGNVKLKVNYRVGALVLLAVEVDEPMRIDGSLEEFNVIKKVFWDNPITLVAKVHNTGNVHYRVHGQIEVKKFGKKYTVVNIDSENIYPDITRIFTEYVKFSPWDYGMYSAILNMESEDGSLTFNDEVPIFFVIPWKTTVMIISGIILIIILMKWFKRRYKIIKNKKEN